MWQCMRLHWWCKAIRRGATERTQWKGWCNRIEAAELERKNCTAWSWPSERAAVCRHYGEEVVQLCRMASGQFPRRQIVHTVLSTEESVDTVSFEETSSRFINARCKKLATISSYLVPFTYWLKSSEHFKRIYVQRLENVSCNCHALSAVDRVDAVIYAEDTKKDISYRIHHIINIYLLQLCKLPPLVIAKKKKGNCCCAKINQIKGKYLKSFKRYIYLESERCLSIECAVASRKQC